MGGYLTYDGARISAESPLGKELMKWERKPDWTPEKNQFPKMLYRAEHRPDGKRSVHEVNDSLFPVQGEKGPIVQAGAAEQWSRRCQLTVYNEAEMVRAMENGWRKHPNEALEVLEAKDNAVAAVTAERHYKDARMSEPAQREAAAIDQTTLKHLPEIPEKPRVKKQLSEEHKAKLAAGREKAREAKKAAGSAG